MRILWQEARERIHQRLDANGYADIRAEHFAVLQYPGPEGERPSTLAARAGLSRQAMNRLLGHLEDAGYLRRQAAPDRSNARIVSLTPRGEAVMVEIKAAVADLEREWAGEIGEPALEELRAVLSRLRRRSPARSFDPDEEGPIG